MKKLVLLVCLLSVGMYQNALAYPALPGFADVAEKLLPSVVSVTTSSNQDTDAPSADDGEAFPPGSPYEEFFRQFFLRELPFLAKLPDFCFHRHSPFLDFHPVLLS